MSLKKENNKSVEEENDLFPKEEKSLSEKDEIQNMPINLNKNETTEKIKMKIEKEISKIEIGKGNEDYINQKSLKNIKQENANNNNKKKILYKENEEVKIIKGDFDFLISDISPQELIKVLKNKENAPFIFYNNINFEKISDIIGETKEYLSNEKKPIEQIHKYFKLFKELNSSENICHSVGLKKENQKILMYVFNSEYKDYLTKMLNYNAHQKLFKEVLEEYKRKSFYSSFQNELIKNKKDFKEDIKDTKVTEIKLNLIDELVDSKLPYICLYLPNVLIEKYNEKKNDNEMISKMEKLDKKDTDEMINKMEKLDKKDNEMINKIEKLDKKDTDEMINKMENLDKKDNNEMAKRVEILEKQIRQMNLLFIFLFIFILYILFLKN